MSNKRNIMITTYYIKRHQVHQCKQFGIQVSPCRTDLLRATSRGRSYPIIWEWVSTGQKLAPTEVQCIMKVYPVCKFQHDTDLASLAIRRRYRKAPQAIA